MEYAIAKWLHVLSSTVLFGTGIGSAFYFLAAALGRDARTVASVAGYVVVADWLFTATTAVAQPLTGYWLMRISGMGWDVGWVRMSVHLYIMAIACWLPVVWLQIRMRNLARHAAAPGLLALFPRLVRAGRGGFCGFRGDLLFNDRQADVATVRHRCAGCNELVVTVAPADTYIDKKGRIRARLGVLRRGEGGHAGRPYCFNICISLYASCANSLSIVIKK